MNSLKHLIKRLLLFQFIFMGLFLFGCEDPKEYVQCVEQPDVSNISVDLDYISLTDEFLTIDSLPQLQRFLSEHPMVKEYILRRFEYPSESIFLDQLFNKITNPYIDSLRLEVDRIFGDEAHLKREFEDAFRHLKYYYPDVALPKIKTIASGFDQDLYVSDSLIIVGLDYYLGDETKYRPLNMYQYILDRYRPQYVVPSTMLIYGISPRFNNTALSDNTVLAEMIAYGKAFYFAKHMMPCKSDSVLIWYTEKELAGVRENENVIWSHFVENELLYESSHEVKRKYIEERPKTYEIGSEAPGRIGTWLGWQIIREYMDENPEISLPDLMAKESAQEIFESSNYRPQ